MCRNEHTHTHACPTARTSCLAMPCDAMPCNAMQCDVTYPDIPCHAELEWCLPAILQRTLFLKSSVPTRERHDDAPTKAAPPPEPLPPTALLSEKWLAIVATPPAAVFVPVPVTAAMAPSTRASAPPPENAEFPANTQLCRNRDGAKRTSTSSPTA